ncbi:MAG: hypothetical protein ACOYN4_18710 [Bacteroidales bacterium]
MKNSKPQVAASAIIALLLFLAPSFVQDYHRLWGHQEKSVEILSDSEFQIHNQHEKCAVCVFDFNIVEDIAFYHFTPDLHSTHFFFIENNQNQVQESAFHYYNLRAPPKA